MKKINKSEANKNKTVFGGMGPGSITILRSLNYKPESAIAEFIDNSVQSYFDNKRLFPHNHKLKISINLSHDKENITIQDNAAGISDSSVEYALKAGNYNHKRNSLNEFGMGMKSAAFWFTKTWTIETKAINEKHIKIINMDIDEIVKVKNGKIKINTIPNNELKSFTKIILKNCDKSFGRHKNIILFLESIHRNFLSKDIQIKYCYDRPGSEYKNYVLKFTRPKFSKEIPKSAYKDWLDTYETDYLSKFAQKNKPKKIYWKVPINIKFGFNKERQSIAHGFIAKLVTSSEKRGIYYFRRNKMIEGPVYPKSLYTSQRGSGYEYKYIYGEIHFDNVESSFTKDRLLIPERDINHFEMQLSDILRDKNKHHGTSFWDQLRVGIDGYQQLVSKEKKSPENLTFSQSLKNISSFSMQKQFEAIRKNLKETNINRNPGNILLNDLEERILINKHDKIKIDGRIYKITIITKWDKDYSESWLNYKIDKKNKDILVQVALSHVFFKEFFFDAATSIAGKEIIKNGIMLLSEFLISSIIYTISVSGIKKADKVLNNLNSILKEFPTANIEKVD